MLSNKKFMIFFYLVQVYTPKYYHLSWTYKFSFFKVLNKFNVFSLILQL